MVTQSPYVVPGLNADAIVQNPALNQLGDTSPTVLAAGRHGEQLVSEIHGKRYVSASRNNLWWGSTGNTGVSIIAPGGTTGGAVLYNSDNTKYLEVHFIRVTTASVATAVIAGFGLEASKQTPTGTLTGTVHTQMPLGATIGVAAASSLSVGKMYGACTITAMTYLGGLGMSVIATTSAGSIAQVDLDGSLIVGPGVSINLVSSITQSTNKLIVDYVWSEWLP